jgi:AAA family ATP:ADP antiporter
MRSVAAGFGRYRAIPVLPEQRGRLILSTLYFTLLLLSYYMLRPLRDALAATVGSSAIKYLSTTVFAVMVVLVPIFGWLVSQVSRRRLLPAIHGFAFLNLLAFAALFHARRDDFWTACAFYVWLSVFNFFIVSLFWSFMADLWREREGRALFGVISAGGSLGGIVGPLVTRAAIGAVGSAWTVAIASVIFAAAAVCLVRLERSAGAQDSAAQAPLGGSALEGISLVVRTPFVAGIAVLVVIGALLGMIVYIELARLVAASFPTTELRAQYFSGRDVWVNALACLIQFGVLGRLTGALGVGRTLALSAALAVAGFAWVGIVPTLGVLTAVNVVLRVGEFGLAKPARDMLYTVVAPSTRYKAKNFIDTALYRASDMASGWCHDLLAGLGLTLAGFGFLGVGLGAGLGACALAVGRGYRRRGGV